MANCFIFTRYLTDDGCLMLRFNDQGNPDLEPQHYSFKDIIKYQDGYSTVLVYPGDRVSLFDLELPWLPERKARAAIPYALEDKLTQSIENLHFAFDKQHYKNNHYEITVLEKRELLSLIDTFNQHGVEFDSITLDWYALKPNECIHYDEILLVNCADFKGGLSPELVTAFQNNFEGCTTFSFTDSKLSINVPHLQKLNEKSYQWISKRLLESKPLNLCQGEIQHGTSFAQITQGYYLVAGLCVLWLISIISLNAFKLYFVNTELAQVDQQIATIYKQFFPDAKQVISPKYRITQLLGETLGDTQSSLWNILNKLAQAIKGGSVSIEQVRFQNKILIVTVACSDFANLEQLENRLKNLQLKVNQTQAANRDQQVIATLELM